MTEATDSLFGEAGPRFHIGRARRVGPSGDAQM